MGNLKAVIGLSLIVVLYWSACASSNRYVGESVREPVVEIDNDIQPLPVIEQPEDTWQKVFILESDTTYVSVDSAAANRASRYRWLEVIDILEAKAEVTVAEAYLLATAYTGVGNYSRAIGFFRSISEDTAFVLHNHAKIALAKSLAEMDSTDVAISILDSLPIDFTETAIGIRYEILLWSKRYTESLVTLTTIETEYPKHFKAMELRLARANLQIMSGDTVSAVKSYGHILRNNSGYFALAAAKALDAIDELDGRDLYYAGNAAVKSKSYFSASTYLGRYLETDEKFKRGEAQYFYARSLSKRGRYSEAIGIYKDVIEEKSYNRAWAELGISWCYRKLKQFDSARKYVHKAIENGNGSNAEAEALWEAVELYEDLGDYDSAGVYARKLSQQFPFHELGDNGAMWAGLGAFVTGDYETAAIRFGYISKKYTDRKFTEMGDYWRALAQMESGDSAGKSIFVEIADSPIRHYYRYRAVSEADNIELPNPAGATSLEWMTYPEAIESAKSAISELGYDESILPISSVNARRAEVFAAMGLSGEAGGYFSKWMAESEMSPSVRIAFLQTAVEWRLSASAYQIALKLVSDLGGYANAPVEVIRLAYPTIYEPYIREAAKTEGIDPAFLFAIIRRESAFDPHAESYAGAIGLCQFMPATAKTTAGQLGEGSSFDKILLYDWETSIRYAAHHIAVLFEDFEEPEYVLAAYNAGPPHVERWRNIRHEGQIEIFVEAVDFVQTRHYMKNVLGDYWAYKELWDNSI